MSTFIRGVNMSKKTLKIVVLTVLALVCATAITLGIIFSYKQNYVVTPEDDNKFENLDSESLLTVNGWGDVAFQLVDSVNTYGNNVALGNSGGVISSPVVSLGGISWTVVYSQNGIVTLYANESVAELAFGSEDYEGSAVRDYLLNEFYPKLLQSIGENNAGLIVPYGDKSIYYQAKGAQNVGISTLNNNEIVDNDGVNGDAVWLPSAYEVGGFANTETSPQARVNSFKTIKQNGFEINSGLWNTSNEMRLTVDNAWLRSNINNEQAIIQNGVVKSADEGQVLSVRPCINLALPQYNKDDVVSVSANESMMANDILLANADYKGMFTDSVENGGGGATGDGSSSSPFTVSNSQMLVLISDAVMAGQNLSGVYFQMTANIDMSGVTVWDPIGREGFPFSGVFDGNGFTISNLATSGTGLVGLFGYVENATIQNVGVVNSSWYTTNSNVGAIAGTAVNSSISQCYSDSGVSGGTNVGGLVGTMNGGTLTNCYNLNGVSGASFVGGLVGNLTSGTVSASYNAGSVQGTTGASVGGVAGAASGTVTSCYFYNSPNNSIGTQVTTIDAMRTQTTFAGFTFGGSPWFMSNVLNDRMPMLHNFLKSATVNLLSSNDSCSVGFASATGTEASQSDISINTGVTITAFAAFADSEHYVFDGWYKYDVDSAGNKIENLDENGNVIYDPADKLNIETKKAATTGGFNFTATLTVDDYYNLEARFIRVYNFEVSPTFAGFGSDYGNGGISVTTTSQTYDSNLDAWVDGAGAKWYPEDAVVTVDLGNDTNRVFTGLYYGLSSTSTNNQVPIDDKFISQNGTVYTININNDTGAFGAGDTYYLNPKFDRVYLITTTVSVPQNTPVTPVSQVAFTNSSGSAITVTSSEQSTQYARYNNASLVASIRDTPAYAGILTFTSWTLSNADGTAGTMTGNTSTTTPETFNLATVLSSSLPADVTTLNFAAAFSMAPKQITVTENIDDAGKVVLSNAPLSDISSATEEASITANYGTTVYLYILPVYANGYVIDTASSTLPSGSTGADTGVYFAQIPVGGTDDSITYNVNYVQRTDYQLTFNVTVDGGTPADAGLITLKNGTENITAPISNQSLSSSVATYSATVRDADYQGYFLANVQATIGGTTNIICNYAPSSDAYVGTQGEQPLFRGLTTQTIEGIYNALGVIPSSNNQNITITVNFITITRSISVTERVDTVVPTTSPQKYEISATNGMVNGSYLLNDSITVTINAGNIGYKVTTVTVTNTSGKDSIVEKVAFNPNDTTYNNSATVTFTLSDNATVTIDYALRDYPVAIVDNLGATAVQVGNSTIKGINSGLSNTYSYTLNSGAASQGSSVTAQYGDTLTINSGYITDDNSGSDGRRVLLDSIYIVDATTHSILRQFNVGDSITFTFNDQALTDSINNVQIVFVYQILQSLNVSFTDGSSIGGNAALLVVLENVSDPSDRIILIIPAGGSENIECQVGQYKMTASVSIFIQTSVDGDVTGDGSTGYTVTIDAGQAASVGIDITGIINGEESVFGSGTV